MKSRILLISKFFLFLLLFGVENNEIHAEMFQIGTKWYYNKQSLTTYPSHGYVVYEVVADTLIENKSCKQVLSTSVSADGLTSKLHDKFIFYENSNRIYYYLNGNFDLMYDFGLNQGDELKVKILSDVSNNPVSSLIIDSISTIQVNGQNLKVQYVSWSYMDPFQNVIVKGERKLIESIGNEDAFLFTPSCLQSDHFGYLGLRCLISSNISYTSPYWSYHFKNYNCDDWIDGTKISDSKTNELRITTPLLLSGVYIIESSDVIESISVFNCKGLLIGSYLLEKNNFTLHLNSNQKGILFILIKTQNNRFVRKIVNL